MVSIGNQFYVMVEQDLVLMLHTSASSAVVASVLECSVSMASCTL